MMKRWVFAGMLVLFSLAVVVTAWAQDVVPTPIVTPTPLLLESPTPVIEGDGDIEIRIDPEQAAQDAVQITQAVAEATAGTLAGFLDQLARAPRSDVARVLLVLGGAVLLLVGWRVADFVIVIAGALIGASVATALVTDPNEVIQIIALILGALVGAALASLLYYVAVFFIGAYVGIVLFQTVAASLGYETVDAILVLVAALIGGILLLGLAVYFLLFLSVLVGAQMVVLGLNLDPVWLLILVVIGLIIQVVAARAVGDDIRRRPRPVRLFRRRL
jgi:hypothetical protein